MSARDFPKQPDEGDRDIVERELARQDKKVEKGKDEPATRPKESDKVGEPRSPTRH
jgi:hypothetical protein